MKNLATLRKQRGLSQLKLASEIGLARNTICQYESGSRIPDVSTLVHIADYFGVSVDYLLGHETQEKKSSLMERPDFDVDEKFVGEFGPLLSEKNFIDFAKLYKMMNEAQKTFLLARTVGYLNGLGINTQAVVGY